MKRISLSVVMLAIAASCTLTEIDSENGSTAPEITASFEQNDVKTTITNDDDGVGTIWWKPADEINVFYGTSSTHYISKNKQDATTVAFGSTDIIGSTESADRNIWALYPYDEDAVCDGASVTTTIPAMQEGVAGTFDDDLFTSLAHSETTTMTFYNVLGGVKFSLSRDDIRRITFKGNNDEGIAGKVRLSMDADDRPEAALIEGQNSITLTPKSGTAFASGTYYYIVMLPTVLSDGFTMTFETEDELGTFVYTEKSIEIKRSVFGKKENIDSYASFEDRQPLTISSIGSTSVQLSKMGSPDDIALEFRKSVDGEWSDYSIGSPVALEDGEYIQFRAGDGGNGHFSKSLDDFYYFELGGTGLVTVSGDIMSLMGQERLEDYCFPYLFAHCDLLLEASELRLPAFDLTPYCYCGLFGDCTNLTSAPELPATVLAEGCYGRMFYGCTNLAVAPNLPAKVLDFLCYTEMFVGCKSLEEAPELPATDLVFDCYLSMFEDCTSLTVAPDLPATTLAVECYGCMFRGCTNLRTAPALPASTLTMWCYQNMFSGCTSLTAAPDIPATVAATQSCISMFKECTNLVVAPKLPATTLENRCYGGMFSGCTSLTTAPELPATTLADGCYGGMFSGCTSLTTAPKLPAITLADCCYNGMFLGCTSLTTAPELPAITLADGCYNGMFSGCSNLCEVKAMFITCQPDGFDTDEWLDGVSSSGTFYFNRNATWYYSLRGPSGIPIGWNMRPIN